MIVLAAMESISPTEVGLLLLGITTLAGIFLKLTAAKKEIVSGIISQLRAEQQTSDQSMAPQPFRIVGEIEHVARPDFHKHAEINRNEHARIETNFATQLLRVEQRTEENVRRIEQSVNAQGREISEIKALREANHEQLGVIGRQLTDVASEVGEISGVVHQLVREGKGK